MTIWFVGTSGGRNCVGVCCGGILGGWLALSFRPLLTINKNVVLELLCDGGDVLVDAIAGLRRRLSWPVTNFGIGVGTMLNSLVEPIAQRMWYAGGASIARAMSVLLAEPYLLNAFQSTGGASLLDAS